MRAAIAVALLLYASPATAGSYVAPDGRTEAELIAAHVLPDPAVAPGVLNPEVSNSTTATTICKAGWTATVRPPTRWTNKLRDRLTPAGNRPLDGELDHRLSIEDGGAPADPRNLWWQVYRDRYGARVKDVLETRLKRLVCAGTIGLDEARNALLGNWLTAYQRFVGPLPGEPVHHPGADNNQPMPAQ